MKIKLVQRIMFVPAVLFSMLLAVSSEVNAQQSERRRSSRTPRRSGTRPISPPNTQQQTPQTNSQGSTDPTVISTAEENRGSAAAKPETSNSTRTGKTESEEEKLRRTVRSLSSQVTRLSEDLDQLREQQQTLVDMERLSRAEQRAETLRAQLRDVTDKEYMLQDRAAELDEELQPSSIDRRMALVGTVNPTEAREQLRRSLEREKERVRKQLEMLGNSRARLETAVTNADAQVERIRALIEEKERQQRAGRNVNNNDIQVQAPPASSNEPTNLP